MNKKVKAYLDKKEINYDIIKLDGKDIIELDIKMISKQEWKEIQELWK